MPASPTPLAAMLCMLMLPATACLAGIKTDVVEFGGSRMVGEVKKLSRGKLYFKTDATDTITIDWADVTSLSTNQHLRVERSNGAISAAEFLPDAPNRHLILHKQGDKDSVPMEDVVAFEPLEPTFWDQIDIDLSLGYSFTKSSEIKQVDMSATIAWVTTDRTRQLSLYSNTDSSKSDDSNTREGIDYQTLRFRADSPYFNGFNYSYESSDSLSLDYRVLASLIGGREFYPMPNQRLRPVWGVALTQERFASASEENNVELLLGAQIDWYRFTTPELDLSSTFIVYPSVTNSGRVRSSLDIELRWEIVEDLFWQLTFYDDYDSDPPAADPSAKIKNDYGVTTGLGWTW